MIDVETERIAQGVPEDAWREATRHCHRLRVARVIEETHDAISIVFEVPPALEAEFQYRAGQFLSFKVPYEGHVLGRSYSLSSSPESDPALQVTVKRVDEGRISNWMNDRVTSGSQLSVVPPAGHFVLDPRSERDVVLFSGGSGITPCISIIKTTLASSRRKLHLVYANRDARSIIFRDELAALRERHPDRLTIRHFLDDDHGFITREDVAREVGEQIDRDFFLCGPDLFMATVEAALEAEGVAHGRVHIERFLSPPDHFADAPPTEAAAAASDGGDAPDAITIVLDGKVHEVPYQKGERVLEAARRAGLDPPFSCEEGYCSCCMAKATGGEASMAVNDCLTPELLEEGWVLTCQASCVGGKLRFEYPD